MFSLKCFQLNLINRTIVSFPRLAYIAMHGGSIDIFKVMYVTIFRCVCLFAVVLFLSEQLVRTQIVRNPHSLDGKFTIVHSNKRLTSVTPLFVKPASSIGHCLAHCLYNKDCQSVNWNDGQKSCELLKESSTASNLSEDVGWVFYGPEVGLLYSLFLLMDPMLQFIYG